MWGKQTTNNKAQTFSAERELWLDGVHAAVEEGGMIIFYALTNILHWSMVDMDMRECVKVTWLLFLNQPITELSMNVTESNFTYTNLITFQKSVISEEQ